MPASTTALGVIFGLSAVTIGVGVVAISRILGRRAGARAAIAKAEAEAEKEKVRNHLRRKDDVGLTVDFRKAIDPRDRGQGRPGK